MVNYLWSGSYSGHAFDPEFEHSTLPVQEFPHAMPITQQADRSGWITVSFSNRESPMWFDRLSDLARIRTYLMCHTKRPSAFSVQQANGCPPGAKFRVVVSQRRFMKAFPRDLTQGPEVAPPEVFRPCGWLIPKLLAYIAHSLSLGGVIQPASKNYGILGRLI
jgi:hypothetical protein